MQLHGVQWALVALCALLVGMAKTGVPGLGVLAVTIMTEVADRAISGSGLLLPLLSTADVFAVWYYRRHASVLSLWRLFPWVVVGGVIGWLVMKRLDDPTLRFIIGIIVLGMVILHLLRTPAPEDTAAPDWVRAAVFGVVAGFATQVANAAGPVMSVYLLSMALPKDQFMGTGAWYFLVINLIKIPGYLWLDPPIITPATLGIDARMVPMVVLGALSGRWIYRQLPQVLFDRLVVVTTVVGALMCLRPKLMGWLLLA